MDLCDDAFSRSMGLSSSSGGGAGSSRESDSADEVKSCAGCQTTKTPLWRGGPTGPKSLCNACGIRYSKNRRTSFGPKEGGSDGEKKQMRKPTPSAVVFVNQGRGLEVSLKLQVLGLGSDAILNQRSMIQKQRRRMMRRQRRFGEVERAAKLLMALSSGVLYA